MLSSGQQRRPDMHLEICNVPINPVALHPATRIALSHVSLHLQLCPRPVPMLPHVDAGALRFNDMLAVPHCIGTGMPAQLGHSTPPSTQLTDCYRFARQSTASRSSSPSSSVPSSSSSSCRPKRLARSAASASRRAAAASGTAAAAPSRLPSRNPFSSCSFCLQQRAQASDYVVHALGKNRGLQIREQVGALLHQRSHIEASCAPDEDSQRNRLARHASITLRP
jgi:hypothetical protein